MGQTVRTSCRTGQPVAPIFGPFTICSSLVIEQSLELHNDAAYLKN